MIATRLPQLALVIAAAAALAVFPAATVAGEVKGPTVRAEGRAPIQGGRADAAYQQALDEAFRRGLLDALRGIAPERQSPQDLETWQETILIRAGDFVGSWRILSQDQANGFLTLVVEIGVYREKLARAARLPGSAVAPAPRVLVLAAPLPMLDRTADEEIDAGRVLSTALEAELARRGAIIVATAARFGAEQPIAAASEERRTAQAIAAARKFDADGVLLAHLTQRADGLVLQAKLIAVSSEAMLVAARLEIPLGGDRALPDALARAAGQLAVTCAPHLASARTERGRASSTRP